MLVYKNKIFALSVALLASSIFTQSAYASEDKVEEKNQNIVAAHSNIKTKLLSSNLIANVDRSNTRKETLSKARMTKLNLSKQQIASQITYEVVAGDNLTKISKKFNVAIEDIMEWNRLPSPDVIYAGQVLSIYGPSGERDLSKNGENNDGGKIYPSSNPTFANEVNDELEDFQDDELNNDPSLEEYTLMKEKEIEEQLAKEYLISTDPTIEGQAIYEMVLEIANEQLGVPYKYGGNTPEGFDCSGFVRYVYFNAGLNMERKSSEDYFMKDTTIIENPVPGDIIFFKNTYKIGVSHMGIYIGDGKFIHAGSTKVEVGSLELDYWKKRFVAFKRFNGIDSY